MRFLKSEGLQKALFTHVLQSFEDRKTTRRRLNLEQPAPSPQRKLASASWSYRKGVSCRKLDLKFNCTWCFNCQRHWGLQGGWRNIPQEKEGPCNLSSPGKGAMSTWSSFRSITCGDGPKISNPPNVPQLHPVERFMDSLKQAVYAGSWEASTLISWRKESTWRSKTLMWDCYETHSGALWLK